MLRTTWLRVTSGRCRSCSVLFGGLAATLLCTLLCIAALPARAELIDLEAGFFGARDFKVDEDGYLEGAILNISGKVLRGVKVEVTALDMEENTMWMETVSIPVINPDKRHDVFVFIGPEAGQPASYSLRYQMDTSIGENPYKKVVSKKRQVGFTISGNGDFRTRTFQFEPGNKTISLEYEGEGELVVLLVNEAMDFQQRLFDIVGTQNATQTVVIETKDAYTFDFTTDGAWRIRVEDPLVGTSPPKTAEGDQGTEQNGTEDAAASQNATPKEGAAVQDNKAAPAPPSSRRQLLILE